MSSVFLCVVASNHHRHRHRHERLWRRYVNILLVDSGTLAVQPEFMSHEFSLCYRVSKRTE